MKAEAAPESPEKEMEKTRMTNDSTRLNVPIGRIEFLGQVLNIVEHDGRLVAACTDETGMPCEVLSNPRLDAFGCCRLMRESVFLLFQTAELSLALSAFTAARHAPPGADSAQPAAQAGCHEEATCRRTRRRLRLITANAEP